MADPAEIMDQMFGGESAKNRFISSTLDPQKSQRAVELEKETGIDSEAISNDVDDIDQFHKKNLAKYIIENNTKLQGYIDSHPMAAGVSQNDLGQLDNVSKKIDDLGENKDHGIFNHAFEVGREMFVDPWVHLADADEEKREQIRMHLTGGGQGMYLFQDPKKYDTNNPEEAAELERQIDKVIAAGKRNEAIVAGGMLAAGWAHKLATGGFLVGAGAFREYVAEPLGEALDVGHDVIEQIAMLGLGFVALPTMHKANVAKAKAKAELDETLLARAKMYLESGKAMPVGMDKQVDRAIEKVSKDYWKKIDEVAAEADKSETKELNSDFFKTFAEKHPNIANLDVLVDAEAVKRLYGDKEPTAGDNILGFMDALPSLLRVNESIDVPIRISMAEWIAKVPSEVRKELHDDAKIKPGSVSKVEAEDLKLWAQVGYDKENITGYHGSTDVISEFDPKKTRLDRGIFFSEKPELANKFAEGTAVDSDPLRIFGEDSPTEIKNWVKDIAGYTEARRIDAMMRQYDEAVKNADKDLSDQAWKSINTELRKISQLSTEAGGGAPNVSKVGLRLGKTHEVDMGGKFSWDKEREAIDFAKANGFESVKFTNFGEKGDMYSVFSKDQIITRESEALRTVRQTSGLEPTSEIFDNIKAERKYGAEKLKLSRLDEQGQKDLDINLGSKDAFDITDEKGNVVGTLQGQKQGTNFFVDWVSSRAWAQSFGPKQVRTLIEELKREYPDLESISGNRVSGARSDTEKQGELASIKLDAPGIDQIFADAAKRGPSDLKVGEAKWEDIVPGVKALVKPKQFWKENELRIRDIVNEVLVKILPEGTYKVGGAQRLWHDNEAHGLYIPVRGSPSLILWSMASNDRVHTIAHEGMHHLRQIGAITKEEWSTLVTAAEDENWMRKYDIEGRYSKLAYEDQIEEAIAEKFGDVVSGKFTFEEGSALGKIAQKIVEILTELRTKLKEAFGRDLTADDIFERARTGGMKRRSLQPERPKYTFDPNEIKASRPTQPELPGLTRVEDQEAFKKGMDLGMTQKMLKQYMAAIEASREIDRKAIEDKALEFERKKQTKWWKDEAAKLEPEVQAELESLPDFQANEFFRTGLYGDEKLSKLPKLNPEFIDEDTLRGIPEKYLSEKGMHPDDVAGLLGINTGRALVGMLADFAEAQGDLQHAKFVDKLVRGEVERRMEKAHGPLSENIIDWAQDHVLNNGQLELIHQEVLAAALRAGKSELPLSKKDIEAAALDKFRQLSIGSISTESALRSLGKAQRQAVMALLDGDPVAALKHEQDRMMQFFIAREAKKLEKAGKSFMRNVERFSDREVTNFPQVYTNWIHDILMKMNTGKLNFFMEDWQKRIDIEAGGVGKESLWDFVSYKMQNDMLEIAYDDRLFDDRLRTDPVKKDFEDLTVEEFYKGHGFLKSMIHNGRMEARGDKIMEAMTHDKVVVDLVNQIALSPAKPIKNAKGERVMLGGMVPLKAANIIRRAGVAHLQWEAIANRIDRGNPNGPFSTYVMRPLIEAANYVHPLEKKYAAMLKDMDKVVKEKYGKQNLKEKIENTLFHEPLDKYTDPADQRPMNMTRENLRAVMLYWGSETGREKLSRGYSAHPDDIQAWIDDNATKADYMWAQEYWKVRKALKAEVDVMYQNIAGAPPEDLRLAKWITPFGDTIEGGYHPLRPHPNADMTKFGAADTFKDGLIRQNFFRATTANGHVMRRTGAVYPLDVGLDSIGTTFKQQIYDLAMRPGLIEASKYLNDDRVRIALGRHMGKEYVDMIKPYLGDVANAMNEEGASAHLAMRVFNAFRSNVIGTLVGFNPGTVLKHGPTALVQSVYEVGASNFARAMFNVWGRDHDTGKSNWKFAVDTSDELQRRERNYQETLQGLNSSMLGKRPLREKFMQVAAWPVAKSDMISAVPTWLAQYEKSMVEGLTHGDSVYMADRAVRRAHGSTAVTNRPEVMRGGAAMGLLNPVYGFFSHILNRQYEMAWKAKDLAGETKRGEVSPVDFAKRSGALAGMFAAYIVAPSIIEELVSPLPSKEDEGAGEKIGKALAFSVASSWIGIRDIAHFAIAGFNPSGIGVAGPAAQSMRDVVNDISSKEGKAFDEANVGRSLKHLAILSGMLTGIPNAQIGRWAQLAWEYSIDKDAPDDFWTWAVALRFGQLKGHSRTPDEYAEHIMGAH